jgi:hypothetical protein
MMYIYQLKCSRERPPVAGLEVPVNTEPAQVNPE